MTIYISELKMPDKVKTKLDKSGDVKAFSQTAIVNNNGVIEYCRTSMAALSGSTAGILGLPTLYGFVFYAVSVVSKCTLILQMILEFKEWSSK